MNHEDYKKKALITEHDEDGYRKVKNRLSREDLTMLRVLLNRFVHSTMQLDMFKKKIFYGNVRGKVTEELNFAKLEHGHLFNHLPANYMTVKNVSETKHLRLLHSIIGIAGEAGELADAFAKYLKNGKPDEVNLKEEFGDLEWYETVGMDALKITLDDVWESNNAKLDARYGGNFTERAAANRNLDKERKVLENSHK